MGVNSYSKQIRTVLLIEAGILLVAFLVALGFWTSLCDSSLESCLAEGPILKPATFLLLSIVRPFVFTPAVFIAFIGGKAFGSVWGPLLTAVGSVFSCLALFLIAKFIGHKLVKPWLASNLPATWKFIRSQDHKLVLAARLIPIIPFDLLSFTFGALDFRTRSVVIATFLAAIPEAYIFAQLMDPNVTLWGSTINTLIVIAVCIFIPLLVFEFISRKKGSSLWSRTKAMNRELTYEVKINNDIVKRHQFDAERTPVLLLYGFFSSRRAVSVLERILNTRGFQVMSFNLGGLLGTFFTRGILETANFIDYKIKRQVDRHGFKKFHVVAHSKGGLVALWWLLKLGGNRYCDKVITMGTPFTGSPLTYLILVTPIGLFWRDVWQMRPGSTFLRKLRETPIPDNVDIYCLHSVKDRVATGYKGLFRPIIPSDRVHPIPMDHISHFEFLYRRDVGDAIARILKEDEGRTRNREALGTDDSSSKTA